MPAIQDVTDEHTWGRPLDLRTQPALKGFLATRARGFGEWGRVEAFETAAQAMREGRQGPSKA
ncbi:hypothetical protein DOT79_13470 [Ralstonia pseudosolanacearum]|nr:hypothetical protein DOT79_13470 [Ralstonia pseudosolanacearum]